MELLHESFQSFLNERKFVATLRDFTVKVNDTELTQPNIDKLISKLNKSGFQLGSGHEDKKLIKNGTGFTLELMPYTGHPGQTVHFKPINEAALPHSIERLDLPKLNWISDDSQVEKIKEQKEDATNIKVKVAKDDDRSRKYTLKTWESNESIFIELKEDSTVIFTQEYPTQEIRYFNQDVQSITGNK